MSVCLCWEFQAFFSRNNRLDGAVAAATNSTCQKGVMLEAPSREACACIHFLLSSNSVMKILLERYRNIHLKGNHQFSS